MPADILLKVVAILAGTFLVWLGGRTLDFLFSAAQAKWGRGYNVSGRWTAIYTKNGVEHPEEATLHQVFHRVWGSVENRTVEKKASLEQPDLRSYAVRGTLSADVLVATYELKKRGRQLDCGAFTLVLDPEGEMYGCYSWMDSVTKAPESGRYVWKRKLVQAT